MPPRLALLAAVGLIVWLFHRDRRLRRAPSLALLVPGAWLAILGTRPMANWYGPEANAAATDLEGNVVNLVVLGFLILSAFVVLRQREFHWSEFIRNNKALVAVYLYLAVSTFWSDYTFVALKRLAKDFGCVAMILVLLTQENPLESIRIVFVRCAYLIFPLSVVTIKYYPDIGRNFSQWGDQMYTGLTMQKNSLGQVVLVFGMMLIWDMLELWRDREELADQQTEIGIRVGMLLMGVWLLLVSNSKTALLCLVLGGVILWGTKHLMRLGHPQQVMACVIAAAVVLGVLEWSFGISDMLIGWLGRDKTLTGRMDIWRAVNQQVTDPIYRDRKSVV